MSSMPIPFSFIRGRVSLGWRDALWGYERQMIGWSGIVDLAKNRLCGDSGACVIELAHLEKSYAFRVGELLRELSAAESEKLKLISVKKWLFLVLAWTFENKDRIDDPLGKVEEIYADFDYPSGLDDFVRYLPIMNGYDSSRYSREENESRLYKNWEKYLNVARCE